MIPGSSWSALWFAEYEKSAVRDTVQAPIFDVRIFPPLEAPKAVEHLDGMTIVEAFQRHVFSDPQVAALRKHAAAHGGQAAEIGFERRLYRALWPVAHSRKSVTIHSYVRPPGIEGPKAYVRTRAANLILAERFSRLIGYLAAGTLIAQGTTRDGETAVPIPRALWSRERSYLDLYNGDLLEYSREARDEEESYSQPIFMGLMLRNPASDFNVKLSGRAAVPDAAIVAAERRQTSQIPSPFTVRDVINAGSLADALRDLVLRDPEMEAPRLNAMAVATQHRIPFEADAGLVGELLGHDEPLLPLRYFSKDEWDLGLSPLRPQPDEPEEVAAQFDDGLPAEVAEYYEAINLRATTLFQMLQGKGMIGWGHAADGHLVVIGTRSGRMRITTSIRRRETFMKLARRR
jgi:hypothetical protein